MKRPTVLLLIGFAMISATPAYACMAPQFEYAMIHSELPAPLPENAIVAEVIISDQPEGQLWTTGLKVRVTRWHQGGDSEELILQKSLETSCDRAFGNGRSGIIVGILRESRMGIPVVEVFFAPASTGFRGRYGKRVPTYSDFVAEIKAKFSR